MSRISATEPIGERPQGAGTPQLQRDGVSAAGSVVMAVAGSAPAYSIASSTALLVGAAGLGAPAVLLWSGIPMLGIAWAFLYLGRIDVNAGAAYSWVARALNPILGFLSGWALVISATIFMVAGALPAGTATVALFDPSQANNSILVTVIGAIWFLVMAAFVLFGVHITARAQWVMSLIEVLILFVFAVLMLVHAFTGHHAGPTFQLDWLGFSHIANPNVFVLAALIAAFYFWGWDVSANLNEETKDGHKSAGSAGIIGVLIVFLLFMLFTVGTLMMLPTKTIDANASNVLIPLGQAIWPGLGGKILMVAFALSTIATLETTLVQVTRTLFSMGRDNTIPSVFGRIHRRWRTPAFATLIVIAVSIILFIGSTFIGSVGEVMANAVSSIGVQISFYYALAGIAVVVAYRKVLFASVKNFVFIFLWPSVGALFMIWMFIFSIPNNEPIVNILGVGLIIVGLVPVALFYRKAKAYYSRRPLELPQQLDERAPAGVDDHDPAERP